MSFWAAEPMLPAAAPERARREPRYVLGAATLRRNRSEVRPRGETITEEGRPSAASGEDYLLTTSGPIRVRRRTPRRWKRCHRSGRHRGDRRPCATHAGRTEAPRDLPRECARPPRAQRRHGARRDCRSPRRPIGSAPGSLDAVTPPAEPGAKNQVADRDRPGTRPNTSCRSPDGASRA